MPSGYSRRGQRHTGEVSLPGGYGSSSGASRKGKKNLSGKDSDTFDGFYSQVYGDRWPALRQAMAEPPRKVALYNRYCQLPFTEVTHGLVRCAATEELQVYVPPVHGDTPPAEAESLIAKPPLDDASIRGYYLMDLASVLAVEQLMVGPFDKVLDICAAPGGKSIAIAQYLSPDGHLTSNESKTDRCARLRRNLKDYLPSNFVQWTTTQRNGECWHSPCSFHRVLVDAPCSSERHLVHSSTRGVVSRDLWSTETSRKLAQVQLSLLLRALETCQEGGRIVYGTCSISPFENDGVVAKALERTRCVVEVIDPRAPAPTEKEEERQEDEINSMGGSTAELSGEAPDLRSSLPRLPCFGEPTEYGWMLLPDLCEGWGPIYFAVLHKKRHEAEPSSSESEEEEDPVDSD